jgi:short-subunit dehydrogenase
MKPSRAFDRSMSFSDRFAGAALVTGASAGIGEAFARALAARGMDVVLVARRRDRLEALAGELASAHGVRAVAVEHDLTSPDVHRTLPEAVRAAGASVGLLVNNAGFGAYGDFADIDAEQQARMVDLNCRAPLLLTQAFLPEMRERGTGGVIFLASVAGYQPTPLYATYGATKAFNLMLAEALWAELRELGVAVLGLSPGYTPTEFQQVAKSEDPNPPGGWTSPAEVVETALDAIGGGPSVIPGMMNGLLASASRFAPRRMVASMALRMNKRGPS